ncbi:hypothetical protein R1sor_027206 [Riccia sorocarpa]|uniref:Uncharacterized protein n=1 Tax=Riccia sorocarpa TaxID=122646 RepID=A0ABD3GEA1_9MARC
MAERDIEAELRELFGQSEDVRVGIGEITLEGEIGESSAGYTEGDESDSYIEEEDELLSYTAGDGSAIAIEPETLYAHLEDEGLLRPPLTVECLIHSTVDEQQEWDTHFWGDWRKTQVKLVRDLTCTERIKYNTIVTPILNDTGLPEVCQDDSGLPEVWVGFKTLGRNDGSPELIQARLCRLLHYCSIQMADSQESDGSPRNPGTKMLEQLESTTLVLSEICKGITSLRSDISDLRTDF